MRETEIGNGLTKIPALPLNRMSMRTVLYRLEQVQNSQDCRLMTPCLYPECTLHQNTHPSCFFLHFKQHERLANFNLLPYHLGPCGPWARQARVSHLAPFGPRNAVMHYPHRISRIKRKRSIGFRARMKSTPGRKMMNRKRRVGRSLNVADK